jgi:hypothetical protein
MDAYLKASRFRQTIEQYKRALGGGNAMGPTPAGQQVQVRADSLVHVCTSTDCCERHSCKFARTPNLQQLVGCDCLTWGLCLRAAVCGRAGSQAGV